MQQTAHASLPGTACSNDLLVAVSSQHTAVHTTTALLIRCRMFIRQDFNKAVAQNEM